MPTTMNISLPDALKEFVKERVGRGDFATPSDYIRSLIREDRERAERIKLDQLLLQRLASDDKEQLGEGDLQHLRDRLEAARKSKSA